METYKPTIRLDPGEELPGRTLAVKDTIRYSMRIRRPEFMAVGVTVMIFPALLSVSSPGDIWCTGMLVAAVSIVLTMHAGNLVNCYVDRDLDATYKSRLSEAVEALGTKRIRRQIFATTIVLALLGVYATVTTGHLDLLAIYAIQIALAFQYTTRPLFLKGAGILQIPALFQAMFFGAGLIVIRLVSSTFTWGTIIGTAGFGVAMMGIVLLNTTEDVPEDREFGIRTSAIALGLAGAMSTGLLMFVMGSAVAGYVVVSRGEGYIPGVVMLVGVVPVGVALLQATLSIRGRPEHSAMTIIRKHAKLAPAYLALFGWTAVAAATLSHFV